MRTTKVFLLAGLCFIGAPGSQAQGPGITRQPADQSASLGATVQFTVTATSTAPPITYQWRFNDLPLDPALNPTAATSTLSLTNATLASAGRYAVVVGDASGSAVSASATLSVDPSFTKITTGALVTELGESTGATSGDFNEDGYPDVFVSRLKTGLSTLYQNNRDGSFVASTNLPSQTTADAWWAPAVTADFNNDGKLDLFAPREGKPGFFYFSDGHGSFIASQFLSATVWNVAIADYDRDGWLDIYLSSDGRLFRNNGDGTFTKTASLGEGGTWGGATWADYDDDGWLELFCAHNNIASRMYHQDGKGGFVALDNLATHRPALAEAWGDYDNDGQLDLFAQRQGAEAEVYRSLGNGEFERVVIGPMIRGPFVNSATWVDYDNDGFLDLFLTQCPSPNQLYHNNGDGTFTLVNTGSLVTDIPLGGGGSGYSASEVASYNGLWFDYNNDGFLDLYVCNGNDAGTARAENFLYQNNGNGNAWLKVKLVGTASNHDGIGSRVRAQATYAGQVRWQRRDVSPGDVYSGNTLIAHFGLGDANNVMTLKIEWPSGAVQQLANVAPRQFLTIWEPPAITASLGENGACLLSIKAEPNRTWRIEGSADLENWEFLDKVTKTTALFTYTDSGSPPMACRFFRVMSE